VRIQVLSQFFDPEPVPIPGMVARWLLAQGHDVDVVTGFPNYPGGSFYRSDPVRPFRRLRQGALRVSRVPLYPSHDRSSVRRALNYTSFSAAATVLAPALTERPDAGYVYHPPATSALPFLARRIPFVFHIQDIWPDSVVNAGMIGGSRSRRMVTRGLDLWCSYVYEQSAALVVISAGMKTILVERGVPATKISVIPNWADESIFHPQPKDPSLLDALGIADKFNVMYSGNLGIYQDLDSVLQAAVLLRDESNIQFVFAGSGPMEGELRARASQLGLDNVVFLGRLPYDTMGAVTASVDLLLVTLRDLPFFAATIPSKTQAAMACARPIVMSVSGDAAQLVSDAECGRACTPGDATSMATTIRELSRRGTAELDSMGRRGREYYEAHMSMQTGLARLEELLLGVARRTHP